LSLGANSSPAFSHFSFDSAYLHVGTALACAAAIRRKSNNGDPVKSISTTTQARKGTKGNRMSKLSFKVSLKGAISVYGLGRFPVTLYPEQWGAIMRDTAFAQFVASNSKQCSDQADNYAAAAVLADERGLQDKAKDEFIAKILGFSTQAKSSKAPSAKADLVEKLRQRAG
jgi:hypothetical protein